MKKLHNHPWLIGLCLGAIALCLAPSVQALYRRPDLEKIPIKRLIENLEEVVKKNPKDLQFKHNLARAHAMAYAWKTDTAQVRKGKPEQGAWFGFEPTHVPFARKPGQKGDGKPEDPTKHLSKALRWYGEVIKADPKNLTAQLGHAWLTDKSGKKKEAIQEYRNVIEKAWATEKDKKFAGLGWHSVTAEAGGYLTALLDKEKDAKEIAELKARAAKMRKLPRPITPIVIPMQANLKVSDLVNPQGKVSFDADGSGLQKQWTWITPKAGWLVHDPKATGKITSSLQMFGGVSFWMFWTNGYHAMSALDDNHDGKLTGEELTGLAVWQDRNSNGISESDEVKSLAELEIVELSCNHQTVKGSKSHVAKSAKGVRFRNGNWRSTFDVLLQPAQKKKIASK